MPIEVTMPKLSPTMESGVIAQWLVKVGDTIKEGDVLADIETDKATMPMKSYEDGVIAIIDHKAGDEVALGDRVMVLAKKGEDPKDIAAKMGSAGGAAKKAAPAESDNGKKAADSKPAAESDEAEELVTTAAGGRVRSSPLARKVAAEARVDIARVRGTGPGGRIVRKDVEDFLAGKGAAPAPAPTARPAAPAAPAAAKAPAAPAARISTGPLQEKRIPNSRMRKTIAQRMLQSKQTAPEIHVTVDVRVDKLLALRETLNKELAAEKVKLSVGDFVTKAVAVALRRHPALNATFEPDAIVLRGEVNIGIAVALEEGLIVPVLHRADELGLIEIRKGSEALAAAARGGTLTGDHLAGGTFTISNLGMYGVKQFDAIINLPEVAILAVSAAEKRPVVDGDAIVVGNVMSLTLTADHRAVDGATAADYMRTLKNLLEEPARMLL
ncbi:dihydrolipoamide acetyltransferase family protein [Paludisphaera rhizosphaerae]|uniref:dihydrolipoamide acetyltransferase family protein n=1 Tax=Paludisphaera rhizosphaerae TaxID=2711216 RepID=UPI0013EA3E37|nr:dihydrolipoamide acetyltransferase family protein [Paludisphaera rhizosphaerae]